MKLGYYFSGIIPVIFLLLGTLILHFSLGSGFLLTEEQEEQGFVEEYSTGLLIQFILLLGISLILFYLIFIKMRKIGARVIYSFVFGFTFLYSASEALTLGLEENNILKSNLLYTESIILLIFGVVFSAIYLKESVNSQSLRIRNLGMLSIGFMTGRIIAYYVDLQALIILGLVLAIFDIWNVGMGPLSKVVGKPKRNIGDFEEIEITDEYWFHQINQTVKQGTPVYINFKERSMIGIGDLVIYSTLLYRGLLEAEYLGLIAIFILIIVGNILTFWLLLRISPLPGLPLPVFLSVLGFILLQNSI